VSPNIPAHADFLYDKAAMLRDMMKQSLLIYQSTGCNIQYLDILYYRYASLNDRDTF